MATAKRYRAFISYSQKDKNHAVRLQRTLERYQVPKGVEGNFYLADKRKLGRFFRDDDDMSASGDIGATVRQALSDSEHLIVVCSPNAAKSTWVNSEIHHYREAQGSEGVFAVIVDGEPNSQDEDNECFPPLLRLTDAGDELGMPIEPLGIDVRKESYDRTIARVVSGILGLGFDDLWQRQRRQAKNRRLLNLMFVFLVGVLALIYQARQIWLQGLDQSTILAMASDEQADLRNYNSALRLAALANQSGDLQPTVQAARRVLARSLASLPVKKTLKVTDARLTQARFSPDGSKVAVQGDEVTVWDVATGNMIRSLGEGSGFGRIEYSPNGRYLIASGERSSLRVFDLVDGTAVYDDQLDENIYGAAFSPDSTMFMSGAGTAFVKNVETSETIVEKTLNDTVFSAAFSPNGQYAAFGSFRGEVAVFDVMSRELVSNLFYQAPPPGPGVTGIERTMALRSAAAVHSVTFSPDSKQLLIGYSTGVVKVLDVINDSVSLELDGHSDRLRDGAFSPDGQTIATASRDGTVRFWSTKTGKETAVVSAHHHDVRSIRFHPNGSVALSAGKDGFARVLDVRSGSVLMELTINVEGERPEIWHAEFSDDGTQILTTHQSGHVTVWGRAKEVPVWSRLMATYDGFTSRHEGLRGVRDVSFLKDSQQAVIAGYQGGSVYQHLWDYVEGEVVTTMEGRWARLRDPLVTPDRKFLYSWSEAAYYKLRQYDLESGKQTGLEIEKGITHAVSMSPDGKRILMVNDYFADVVIDAKTMEELFHLDRPEKQVFGAFTPDGTRLVTHGEKVLSIWNSSDGSLLTSHELSLAGVVDTVVTNEEVYFLRVGGASVQFFSLSDPSGFDIGILEDFVTIASYSPDLAKVAIGFRNGIIAVYDVTSKTRLATFDHHSDPSERQRVRTGTLEVTALRFSPDSRTLITSGKDQMVRSFDLSSLFGESETEGVAALNELCRNKLNEEQRLITARDIEIAPILAGREGEDVCEKINFWSGEAKFRKWLPGAK